MLNVKISEMSKLTAITDYKLNASLMIKFVCDIVENYVRKGPNAGYQKVSFSRTLEVGIVW